MEKLNKFLKGKQWKWSTAYECIFLFVLRYSIIVNEHLFFHCQAVWNLDPMIFCCIVCARLNNAFNCDDGLGSMSRFLFFCFVLQHTFRQKAFGMMSFSASRSIEIFRSDEKLINIKWIITSSCRIVAVFSFHSLFWNHKILFRAGATNHCK